jgi:hypothetical protein
VGEDPTAKRATVRLLLECNNACVFCGQVGLAAPGGEASLSDRLAAARADTDEVTFTGGEPTLDPRLAEHVATARSLGFRRIGIQTNGRRLGEQGFASSLAGAGLTDVHLSIHGAQAAVHDYHTGVPGSFVEALAGLTAARASNLPVVVTTVLTRSNFRSLDALPRFLAARGVAAWLVSVTRSGGRLRDDFDRVMPRLGLALPFALNALGAGESLGLSVWIAGAPRCLLGEYARWRLPEEPRAFGVACDGCPARAGCAGVDAAYLERFGGDELGRARARMSGADVAVRVTDLTRLFVGAGEIAPMPSEAPAPKRKVVLPIAGKVRPALAETTAATPRRTGEALREILPDLFAPGEDAQRGEATKD